MIPDISNSAFDTANSNCRMLLDVMVAHGITTAVLSPGSRNTPLAIALAARSAQIHTHIVDDERTAAFIALGIAMIQRKPVILVCTSGTALYNYAPAVAEAYYQKIPLIVISADRPSQWIDQDDSQTLVQPGALDKIVKRSYDISADNGITSTCENPKYESEREWYVNRVANEAAITACADNPGPVHINIQLSNPLSEMIPYRESDVRKIELVRGITTLSQNELKEVTEYLMERRVLLVCGFLPADDRINKAVQGLAELPNVIVMCETISNLHLDNHAYMIDAVLKDIDKSDTELMPDVVISVGGALISRMLKEYIRKCGDAEHWTLGDTDVSVDCFQHLNRHFDVSPTKFFKGITSMSRYLKRKGISFKYNEYQNRWKYLKNESYRKNIQYIKSAPWSELKALDYVFKSMPRDFNLFLSNGTSIRYAQILLDKLPHGCRCNRGVSGIDGTNATALGTSVAYKGVTLLVTGDMSFAYCPEIMNLKQLGANMRIVIINNSGGGIFRFIKTTRDLPIREEYFCADAGLPVKNITEAYGWNYYCASDINELKNSFKHLIETPYSLLEIIVDKDLSANTLLNFFK